jgi:RimJ/RimL family protein N-acetyltransferase
MMRVPRLTTERVTIRPFEMTDLETIHRILDVELADAELGTEGAKGLETRRQWLQWTISSYEELACLNQPPYGDRAITLRHTGELIGACGFVPCLAPFGQLPSFAAAANAAGRGLCSTEFGLFYAISPIRQRQGFATEAARALIDFAFGELQLRRVIATTTYDNHASMRVMQHIGMRIERNPYPDPPWLQVVGIRENAGRAS